MIEAITKPEGEVDGDNLILHPQEPKPHLPNVDFNKMENPIIIQHNGPVHA
mgnify:CR=1 FL=1